jgi:hypothetical protein
MFRVILLLVLLVSLPAHARLGESVKECITRYGEIVERLPAQTPGSDADACIFSKGGITIYVEFKSEKAWKVVYRMPGLDTAAAQSLLSVESSAGSWSAPLKVGNQEVRMSDDHERLALRQLPKRVEDTATFTFVTKAFAAANRAEYEGKLSLVVDEVKRREANRPLKDL